MFERNMKRSMSDGEVMKIGFTLRVFRVIEWKSHHSKDARSQLLRRAVATVGRAV